MLPLAVLAILVALFVSLLVLNANTLAHEAGATEFRGKRYIVLAWCAPTVIVAFWLAQTVTAVN